MRQAEKEIKEFQTRNPLILEPGEEITKKKQQKNSKNQRATIRHYFSPNRDETGREREKRILDPNSAHTRRGAENSEKKSKKIQKIKKPLSDIIFSQNGMRQAEKERKKFYSRIPFILVPSKKISKKIAKKLKKLKNLLLVLFLAKTGRDSLRKRK